MTDRTTGYIPWKTYQKLLAKLEEQGNDKDLLLMTIGVTVALRVGDILKLKWRDFIDEKGNLREYFFFKEKKTNKDRKINISKKPGEIIKRIFERSGDELNDYIFTGNKKDKKPITTQYTNRWLKKICEEHHVDCTGNVSSHLFRKTFARRLLDSSKDKTMAMITLMDIFRHDSLETTKRYIGLRDEEISESYKQIWE